MKINFEDTCVSLALLGIVISIAAWLRGAWLLRFSADGWQHLPFTWLFIGLTLLMTAVTGLLVACWLRWRS